MGTIFGRLLQKILLHVHKLRQTHNKTFCYKGISCGRLITKVLLQSHKLWETNDNRLCYHGKSFMRLKTKHFVTRVQASGGS